MRQMTEAIPNRTTDPDTGFLESNAYIQAFDAERKQIFLQRMKQNSLALYRTCKELGLSHHTVNKHYREDSAFKAAYDELQREYADELEGVSRQNAMNPKSVIERIFQLKALLPSKYADQKSVGQPQITINIDEKVLAEARARQKVIDAEIVEDQGGESANKEADRRITASDPVDHPPSATSSSTSDER
jgi:hypothetical protein